MYCADGPLLFLLCARLCLGTCLQLQKHLGEGERGLPIGTVYTSMHILQGAILPCLCTGPGIGACWFSLHIFAVAGGFARVYKGELDGRAVAMKCLLAQHANKQHHGKMRPAA